MEKPHTIITRDRPAVSLNEARTQFWNIILGHKKCCEVVPVERLKPVYLMKWRDMLGIYVSWTNSNAVSAPHPFVRLCAYPWWNQYNYACAGGVEQYASDRAHCNIFLWNNCLFAQQNLFMMDDSCDDASIDVLLLNYHTINSIIRR